MTPYVTRFAILGRRAIKLIVRNKVQTETVTSDRQWAWIAGASEGLGLAFAHALAERGYNLLLIARRGQLLAEHRANLAKHHNVQVKTLALDLSVADLATRLAAELQQTPAHLAIYNAAYAPLGAFLASELSEAERALTVNNAGLLSWCHTLGRSMAERGSGTLLLMSSLAGSQGTHNIAAYAASKAFINIFGESLWSELKPLGVHVLVCCAGAIRTPGYAQAAENDAPGTLDAAEVAEAALQSIHRGPRFVPGRTNRLAALLIGRWLPRRWAVGLMRRATQGVNSTS